MLRSLSLALCVASASGHGAIISPLSRNAVDHVVGVNTQTCSNITGDKCNNGQVRKGRVDRVNSYVHGVSTYALFVC